MNPLASNPFVEYFNVIQNSSFQMTKYLIFMGMWYPMVIDEDTKRKEYFF